MSEKISVLLSDVTIKGDIVEKEKLITDSKIDGAPEPLSPGIDEYSSDSSLETSSTSSKGILPIGEWY